MIKIYRANTDMYITSPIGMPIHFHKDSKGICLYKTNNKKIIEFLERISLFNKAYKLVSTIDEPSDEEEEVLDSLDSEGLDAENIEPTEVSVSSIEEAREILKQRGYENFLRSWSDIDEKAKSFNLIFKR